MIEIPKRSLARNESRYNPRKVTIPTLHETSDANPQNSICDGSEKFVTLDIYLTVVINNFYIMSPRIWLLI